MVVGLFNVVCLSGSIVSVLGRGGGSGAGSEGPGEFFGG